MAWGPNPRPGKAFTDAQAAECRILFCRRYNDCLDAAVANSWPGFVCHFCDVREPQSREEFRRDVEGIAAMYDAIRKRKL